MGRSAKGREVRKFHHFLHAPCPVFCAKAAGARIKIEVIENRNVTVSAVAIRHPAHDPAHLVRMLEHIPAGDPDGAGIGQLEGGHDPHRGRLPCAIGADETDDVARGISKERSETAQTLSNALVIFRTWMTASSFGTHGAVGVQGPRQRIVCLGQEMVRKVARGASGIASASA